MRSKDLLGSVAEVVDRRAPGFVRFVAALRWGGLRTVRPGPVVLTAEAGAAVLLGVGFRSAVDVAGRRRIRVPLPAAVLIGGVATHLAVWRWDTARWRRRRVALVVDLPADAMSGLVADLAGLGLDVERWERGVRAGTRVHGLWCRTGDVRAVNRRIDEISR